MPQSLNRVMLIDDEEADNFLHKKIILRSKLVEDVCVFEKAQDALQFLSANDELPDLIFLDINMPDLDGWEFLERYKALGLTDKENIQIVILSTSLNPEDRSRAIAHPNVTAFEEKPHSIEGIEDLIRKRL